LFPSRPEARRNKGAVRCRERLGQGSGIRVDGTAGDGLTISPYIFTISPYIKDAGNLPETPWA
jgi:hypothetical protein